MKKRSVLLLATLAALLLLLTSCTLPDFISDHLPDFLKPEPKTAEELWARVDGEMDELDSYEMTISGVAKFFVYGIEADSTYEGKMICAGLTGGDYYYYQKTTTTVTAESLSLDQASVSLDAYHDGRYFLMNEEGGAVLQRLSSPMTKEEAIAYVEYAKTSDSFVGFELEDCANKSFSKREDGTWTLSYSGYTAAAIREIEEKMGSLDGEVFGTDMQDVHISLEITEEFLVKRLSMVFVFEPAETVSKTPVLSYAVEVSHYNTAERKTDELTPADYTEVEDLALLRDIEDMLEEYEESTDASFTLEILQKASYAGEERTVSEEVDEVRFGIGSDGFYYTIDIETGDTRLGLSYVNGVRTTTVGTRSETQAQTRDEAEEFIRGLIRTAQYDPSRVKNITAKGDGVYELLVESSYREAVEASFASMGATHTSTQQTITVTVAEGRLVSMENRIVGIGILQGENVTVVIETANRFH